jgi:uncharacterized peroxidase-related enzyme
VTLLRFLLLQDSHVQEDPENGFATRNLTNIPSFADANEVEVTLSRLALRTIADAPEETKASLTAVEGRNGYLPNLLCVLANAPVALEAYLTVSAINAKGSLTLAQREVVQITAAATHGCAFCVAGHTAIAYKKAGLDDATVDALRSLQPVADPQLNAVAVFTKAVIAQRGRVDDSGLALFRSAGFSDAAALEVVLGVSLATLCNFANNLGQPPLNAELEPYRWAGAESVLA